jgi:uncharacterized protein
MATTYLVVYRPGPAWLSGRPMDEQPLKEHGRYMLGLYANGTMKMAGSFSDGAGGAAMIEVADESAARALVAADPGVASGVFAAEMHPWALVPWDNYLKRSES